MKFEIYMGKGKEWRWRLVAANGEIIARGEGYTDHSDVLHVIQLIKSASADTPVQENSRVDNLTFPDEGEVDEVEPVKPSDAAEAKSVIKTAAAKAVALLKTEATKAAKVITAEATRVRNRFSRGRGRGRGRRS